MSDEIINEDAINEQQQPDLSHLVKLLEEAILSESPTIVEVPLDENGEFVNLHSFEENQKIGNLKITVLEDAHASDTRFELPSTEFETTVSYSQSDKDAQSSTFKHSTGEEVAFIFAPSEDNETYATVMLCLKPLDGDGNDSKSIKIKIA
jgi:hypothetical protein